METLKGILVLVLILATVFLWQGIREIKGRTGRSKKQMSDDDFNSGCMKIGLYISLMSLFMMIITCES
ncbi:hypothetical protein [uncultured Psychroserpens sp.]|uniref:hypothetical protein n=1 Tax=uncultured Psychroserpens sp. TaxID=255436 RepID=UPI002619A8FA|nr:hypothetical protein [uncultured Psychroserpens sp.]